MDIGSVLLWVLIWIVGLFIIFLIFLQIILRFTARFIHSPIPAWAAQFIDNPWRRRIQPPDRVVEWIGVEKGMPVLEIGPGPGTFTFAAAKRAGETGKVYAIDIQPAVIEKLNRKIQQRGVTNLVTKVASAYELPFPDQTFDRIFMVAVLGEIPDKQKALLECRRVLKDDGLLAIGEIMPDPDYPRRKTVINWCKAAGFTPAGQFGGFLHYLLTFRKAS